MAVYRCAGFRRLDEDGNPTCNYEADRPWTGACPINKGGCGRFYNCEQYGSLEKSSREEDKTAADAPSAKKEYIKTGVDLFDQAFSGGLVRGSVILLGGTEGVGKNTLMAMVCAGVAQQTGRKVLLASGEENTDGLIGICQRTHSVHENVVLIGNHTNIYTVMEKCEKHKPILIVLDSLQAITLDGEIGRTTSAEMEAVTQILMRYCHKHGVCGIALNQMNAQLGMKGGTGHKHGVATVACFYHYEKTQDGKLSKLFSRDTQAAIRMGADGDPLDVRTLWVQKNRNGQNNVKVFFEMTTEGQLRPLPQQKATVLDFPSFKKDE